MKPILILAALALSASCSHAQQVASNCNATAEIVAAVDSALAHDTYDAEIAAMNLALCVARDAVMKDQAAVATDATALSAHDPTANAKIIHAQAWLAAHGGPAPTTIKAGLPGGGHNCCWKSGLWSTIPSCGPPVSLTPTNLFSHCACAPIQLWC